MKDPATLLLFTVSARVVELAKLHLPGMEVGDTLDVVFLCDLAQDRVETGGNLVTDGCVVKVVRGVPKVCVAPLEIIDEIFERLGVGHARSHESVADVTVPTEREPA